MKQAVLKWVCLLIIESVCLQNIVYDWDFEMQGTNLPNTYTGGYQQFSYNIVGNPNITPITITFPSGNFYQVGPWHSQVSGTIRYRDKRDLNTTMMDTLCENYNQIICSSYFASSDVPYELSFDYLIDNNVNHASLRITWNGQQLINQECYNHDIYSRTFTVYLRQANNILCIEGGTYENLPIGVLLDNIVLAKQEIRYVAFTPALSVEQLNYIELVSNLTVDQYSSSDMDYLTLLQLYKSACTLAIDAVLYRLDTISVNQNGYLMIRIQILEQYASSTALPVITLPQHRNYESQLIVFVVTATALPRYIYSSPQDQLMIKQSGFYVRILTTIYNICFRVIKIVAFCFVGMRFLNFFYLYLFMMFLNVDLILPTARNLINQIAINTINSKTINYFMSTLQFKPFDFGASYFPFNQTFPNTNTSTLQYSAANITTNLYDIIIDDLIIALFNTAKILLIYYVIFNSKPKFLRVIKQIKNSWILMEYAPILSVVVLAALHSARTGVPIYNCYSYINRAFLYALPILSLFFISIIFITQHSSKNKAYAKHLKKYNKHVSQQTTKTYNFYNYLNYLNLIECSMYFIIPAMVGFGIVYLALPLILLCTIAKLVFVCGCLKNNPNFIYFLWAISIVIQICLVCTFIIPYLIMLFPNLLPQTQIKWMSILRYNSIAMLFMFMGGGFVEIGCCIFNFIKGFQTTGLLCEHKLDNQVQNSYEIQLKQGQQAQLNIQDTQNSQIKTVNDIKDRIQRLSNKSKSIKSKQQISNPFIKSVKFIQKTTPKQQQYSQNRQQSKNASPKIQQQNINLRSDKKPKMTKVITLKHIEPAQQQIKGEQFGKTKCKSDRKIPQSAQQKQIVVKKQKLSKQKSFKLIKKLNIQRPKDTQISDGVDTIKNLVVSNFQKQQNFS